MRIVAFIEQATVIEKILRHCSKWKESLSRAPPQIMHATDADDTLGNLDYSFFAMNCI
ncbi:MAG: hypothetical protein GF350_16115 [Chitinivibrionales bacterium]|nr:hypothetical protein [Chitinivibrionales bacterium]